MPITRANTAAAARAKEEALASQNLTREAAARLVADGYVAPNFARINKWLTDFCRKNPDSLFGPINGSPRFM